jgi:hypothetical protein
MFYGHALSSATREERKIFPNHAGHLFAPESSLALSCIVAVDIGDHWLEPGAPSKLLIQQS